ncbi:hypothetical protein DM2_2202 [Halorubrum sp. DM2]|nr:hypothetical protein DM2_2202 [Halorubrum sp. DM2]
MVLLTSKSLLGFEHNVGSVAREVDNCVLCIERRGFERRERRWSGEVHVLRKRLIEPFEVRRRVRDRVK